jgi:hypothetical protein
MKNIERRIICHHIKIENRLLSVDAFFVEHGRKKFKAQSKTKLPDCHTPLEHK